MSIEFIEYAKFENNCLWSYNSFSRRENCEPFCFSCNLSSFISKFQHLHIWVLCNFFGQEDRRPPKSECARTPMSKGVFVARKLVSNEGSSRLEKATFRPKSNCKSLIEVLEKYTRLLGTYVNLQFAVQLAF